MKVKIELEPLEAWVLIDVIDYFIREYKAPTEFKTYVAMIKYKIKEAFQKC